MSDQSPDDYILPSTARESQRLHRQGAKLYGSTNFLEPFLSAKPERVLDVGCGQGFFAAHCATVLKASRVTGIDPDAGRLARAGRALESPPSAFDPHEVWL